MLGGLPPYTIKASIKESKEVILPADAFQSPQLLMVTGIGLKRTLEKFGIPVVSALEVVGQDMWATSSSALHTRSTSTHLSRRTTTALAAALVKYNTKGEGPLISQHSRVPWLGETA